MLYQLRNEFAFHYSNESAEKIKSYLTSVPDKEQFSLFMSEHHGNCFYDFSDGLINYSILNSFDAQNTKIAMGKLLRETTRITKCFLEFIGECVLVFARKYNFPEMEEIDIPQPPKLESVFLPYFVCK